MSRIRTIKPEFWISEQIMDCSHSARLLFIGLWNFCDDGGVHPANIRKLKAEVFPGDDVTLSDVDGWINELIKHRLVAEFTAHHNGESCRFWFVTGWKHQRIDKPYLKYPPYQEQQASATTPRPFDDHSENVTRIVEEHSAQVVEGKGEEKEGKGREEEAPQAACASTPIPPIAPVIEVPAPEPTATPQKEPTRRATAKANKYTIPLDWTPAETTYAILEKHGIPRLFAEGCIDEFRLYWQERGESRAGWETTFLNNAKRQWERRPPPPPAPPQRNGQPRPFLSKQDRIAAQSEAALAAWMASQSPINVIEGECHEIH